MNNNSNIGFGTAAIGRPLYINLKQNKEAEKPFSLAEFKANGMQTLEDAYNNGIRCFDTSPGYGLAEELMVTWLAHKKDPSISVSTKWGYTYVANFDPKATVHEIKEHSLQKLNEQWAYSKKLMPYLKVYQIHSATLDTGVLENEAVLNRLHQLKKENGLIIGLTTTGANQVEVLQKALDITVAGEQLFQSFQCTFNILDQSVLQCNEALQALQGSLIIKEALANGRLLPNTRYSKYEGLYGFLKVLAAQYTVGVDAIALRYCMDSFVGATILSGATNKGHLLANLEAHTFSLTIPELEKLNAFGKSSEAYWKERKALAWN